MKKIVLLLAALSIANALFAGDFGGKISPSLRLLIAIRENPGVYSNPGFAPTIDESVDIGVRFTHSLDNGEIAALEAQGMQFKRIGGRIHTMINSYGMKVPWEKIEYLAGRTDVEHITSHWKPNVHPCLELSNPEIQADLTWNLQDPTGNPVTGDGVLVADFDTGVDVFHPAFFRSDGDVYNWLDVNNNGQFDGGIDAVDLNMNGSFDPGEKLDFIDGQIYDEAVQFGGSNLVSNADDIYQADWDWLYNDSDNSGDRTYGPWAGYGENDPCFGELFFNAVDINDNNALDIGEQLKALGSSKVYATMNDGEVIRMRGTDIIESGSDWNGHGTGVSGIICGGNIGYQRFTGIAPEADLIMGYYFDGVSFDSYLPWVQQLGCKILLYEFGGWTNLPLDGSTYEEMLVDAMAALGVMQVTPSGNLCRGDKHFLTNSGGNDTTTVDFIVNEYNGQAPSSFFITILWRAPGIDLHFGLTLPDGNSIGLDGTGNWQQVPPYAFFSSRSTSDRGTAQYDIYGFSGDMTGNWQLYCDNNEAMGLEINGYISDNASSWAGGAEWIDYLTNMKTVTWPATADSGFVLGSYSTRGWEQYIGTGSGSIQIGQLSKFSGRGPRIDGVSLLSIIAPGNYDVYSTRSEYGFPFTAGGWRQFSGTSAAGPHVAGAAALLKQGLPDAEQYEICKLLEDHAHRDNFTSGSYTDSTGFGKLRIFDALYAAGVIDMSGGGILQEFIMTAHPNPFNAQMSIEYQLPVSGKTVVKVYDLLGRETALLSDGWQTAGTHSVTFNGKGLSSGVYFVHVKSGKYEGVRKAVLMK